MTSSLSWLDHDPEERERTQRILALFRQREVRDELGFGGIRDSISDQLFPGTSTIQTRLRYMLLVPWMYRSFEEKRVPSREVPALRRKFELALIEPLLASDDLAGVFGRTAKGGLKRLPSSVYWAGLRAWGILRPRVTQEQYHRSLDALYRARANARHHDETAPDGPQTVTWHPKLPDPPKGFPEKLDLKVTREEAEFLLDRLVTSQKQSLLAFLAAQCDPTEVDFPWEHPDLHLFRDEHRELLHHGRLFSEAMYGAAALYNLMLAEEAGRSNIDEYRADISAWAVELPLADLSAWNLQRFWFLVVDRGHAISLTTRHFVETWIGLTVAHRGQVSDNPQARQLIETRENSLKLGRSRFRNRRALDQWGGRAGLFRMGYRWNNAKVFLRDLRAARTAG